MQIDFLNLFHVQPSVSHIGIMEERATALLLVSGREKTAAQATTNTKRNACQVLSNCSEHNRKNSAQLMGQGEIMLLQQSM